MEKILRLQIVDWNNNRTVLQGVARPTANPLSYERWQGLGAASWCRLPYFLTERLAAREERYRGVVNLKRHIGNRKRRPIHTRP